VSRPSDLPPAEILAARHPHGTRVKYVGGCRCRVCRAANTEYARERASEIRAGASNRIVHATRARHALARLAAAGIGRRQVARISGIAHSTLHEIRQGRKRWIREETQRAILGVAPALAPGAIVVDGAPVGQLHELIARLGSKAAVARALGYQTPALQIFRAGRGRQRTATAVRQLHARLVRGAV